MTVDELESHGLVRMDDGEIRGFLSSQSTGVLGLPGEEAPYMIPMSYGFDGESLYFTYVLGSESRKAELTSENGIARFLVYRADTAFNWQSVLLSGVVEAVPGTEHDDVLEAVQVAWRPELFERAGETEAVELYRFRVEDWTGIKHTGLPPGFEGTPPGAESG
ncbi:pyridoxamine 5'-phosphate oxidase family protein [Salinirubellus sp. GCM10025818]|uniref:pyridoxamine 5'-phosphate oxidase family protein n=1 Tax=Salinirubellus TaxID=2162630 RepID=UPI0030D5B399